MDDLAKYFKWQAGEPEPYAWGVVVIAKHCPWRREDKCHAALAEPGKLCSMETCGLTVAEVVGLPQEDA